MDKNTNHWRNGLVWAAQIIAAVVLFQTLYYKFTGAEESVYIFETLGVEPWGRIGAGIAELVAAALLLLPRTRVLGALLGLGVIGGAIGAHLTVLGIVVRNDGGLLFGLALLVAACCVTVLLLCRDRWSVFGKGKGSGSEKATRDVEIV